MKIVCNNQAEADFLRDAIETLLGDMSNPEMFYLEQYTLKALSQCVVVDSNEPEVIVEGSDPRCCGCGSCPVTLPLKDFLE